VAERLVGVLRLGDSLARGNGKLQMGVSRLGGDEFTFLLTGLSDPQDAGRVASRVIRAMRAPFMIDGREIVAAGSIGVAVSPLDGDDAETLLRNADTAMYSAKDCGGGVYRFYSRSMNEQAERKVELEARLRRALERDQLTLHYQPLWDAVGGTVRAAEALLRWHDPEIGDISPAEFVPVAEDAGLITEIGAWVLRTACIQAQRWQAAGYAPIRMGVNVSGHQLRQPEFVGTVTRVLEESGLSADHLELEITESTMMQYDEVTTSVAEAVSDLGVGLSLDDFGTGYSSLSYLRQFPIRRVKIDRSFVAQIPTNADDMAITAAIVAMAHNLLLSVVGEGVETEEQAKSLRDLGCQELQGFLLSPGVPAEDFTRFLRREKDE
jgi:predicted signal transduction protein with EAL and GGDEF domain